MRTSEKVSTISAALYAVHRDLENPRKDAKGQVRGRADYRYLSLPALIDHAKKALKEAQVAVIQEVVAGEHPNTLGVVTTFLHLTGEFVEVGPIIMPAPNDPQQVGSAITYARRYALAAALNLAADEDADAASASLEPRTVTRTTAAGMGDAERGAGEADDGEAPADPAPLIGTKVGGMATVSAQPKDHHEHHWQPSPTLNGWDYCDVKGCGKAQKRPKEVKA